MSDWLSLQYNFDEECDEEAELFLLRPSSLWETIRSALKVVTGQGETPGPGQGLGMSRTDSLTSVIEMQEENCIRIKCKTILTQTGGAVARENKLIAESSAPCGLVARPAAESMIRPNMH